MQAKLVRRSYEFVRLDALSIVLYPILGVTLLSAFGALLIKIGIIKGFHSSAFVALSALLANRVCVRAGLISAALSAVVHEFVFVPPTWELNWPTMEQSIAYAFGFAAAYACGRRMLAVTPPPSAPVAQSGTLPFERRTGNDRSFWSVDAGHDWTEDSRVGHAYGCMYVEQLRSSHFAPPLGWIIKDMVAKGRWTGVEAGFIGVLGMAAGTHARVAPADRTDGDDANDRRA